MLEVASDDLYRARPARDPRDLPASTSRRSGIKGLSARTLRALYNARNVMDAQVPPRPGEPRAPSCRSCRQPRGQTHAFRLMNQTSVLGPLPVGVPPHRRPDAARPVPRLHGRPAHPDGAAQRAPLLHPRARARVPVLLAARGRAATSPGCCTSRRCSTTSPRAAAATTPSSARARCGASAASTASSGEDAQLIEFLVREHLTMCRIAQKEDLSDPDVIAAFAAQRRQRAPPDRAVPAHRGRHPRHQPEGVERLEGQAARRPVPADAARARRRAAEPRRRDRGAQARGAAAAQPALAAARHARSRCGTRSTSATSRATTPATSPGTRARCRATSSTPTPVVRARPSPGRRRPAGAGLRARPAGPVRAHLRLLRPGRLQHPGRQGPHHARPATRSTPSRSSARICRARTTAT